MPTYDFHCLLCDRTDVDVFRSLAEYDTPHICSVCGREMAQLISAPFIIMDSPGYSCPITGKWIEGRAAHKENLKRHDCRVLEAGEKEEYQKRREAEEKALDDALDETVGRSIEAMAPKAQEQLYQELQAGAGTTVVRR